MTAPIGKANYIGGKLLGNFLFALTLMYSLLILSLVGFICFGPSDVAIGEYANAIFSVSFCIILPATFFVVASSVMLPELVDIRMVYLVFSFYSLAMPLQPIRPSQYLFIFLRRVI